MIAWWTPRRRAWRAAPPRRWVLLAHRVTLGGAPDEHECGTVGMIDAGEGRVGGGRLVHRKLGMRRGVSRVGRTAGLEVDDARRLRPGVRHGRRCP
nr:hypothetical protein [Demequina litorisediminis]